jgi:hypothetical protein
MYLLINFKGGLNPFFSQYLSSLSLEMESGEWLKATFRVLLFLSFSLESLLLMSSDKRC